MTHTKQKFFEKILEKISKISVALVTPILKSQFSRGAPHFSPISTTKKDFLQAEIFVAEIFGQNFLPLYG